MVWIRIDDDEVRVLPQASSNIAQVGFGCVLRTFGAGGPADSSPSIKTGLGHAAAEEKRPGVAGAGCRHKLRTFPEPPPSVRSAHTDNVRSGSASVLWVNQLSPVFRILPHYSGFFGWVVKERVNLFDGVPLLGPCPDHLEKDALHIVQGEE
jgi:hypothetical protein